MRIIFFNIWHGKVWNKLEKFLRQNIPITDIFCLLEVNPPLQKRLEELLSDFTPIYKKGIKTAYLGDVYEGRTIFVRKGISILESGNFDPFKVVPTDAGGFLYAGLSINGKKLFIGTIHGKARPGNKLDTPARIKQSAKIIDFCRKRDGPKIIGGDFNLNPNTKSIKMFEDADFHNLVKEFAIKTTRNRFTWDQFANEPGFEKQYFADYCFTSPDVKVKHFEVPQVEVSDHEPLILDFDLQLRVL